MDEPVAIALRFIYSWSRELTLAEWGEEQLDLRNKIMIDWKLEQFPKRSAFNLFKRY